MNLNTLKDFRHAVYRCFKRAGDALFNTLDALSSETAAHSFPELSLSPFFERKWGSLYEALEDGKINPEQLREVFVQFAPLPPAGQYVFVGTDTSNLYRPQAKTLADRTMVPIPNLPECDHAVTAWLVMSSVVLLPQEPGQGTWVLDTKRVRSQDLATGVAAEQVREVVALLVKKGLHPMIIGDRWYACAPFLIRMADVAASCLLRVKSNRVFYRRAPRASQVSVVPIAKMELASNAATRAPMGNRTLRGRAPMPKAGASKCAVGTSCICARHVRSRSV